jgi:hypothetical protein
MNSFSDAATYGHFGNVIVQDSELTSKHHIGA